MQAQARASGTGEQWRRTPVWRLRLHRLASRVVERSLGNPRRERRRDGDGDGGKVVLVLLHAYGISGAIRSVFNLAEELARTREVEIVSVVRQWRDPLMPLPPGVTVTWLDDRRRAGHKSLPARVLSKVPSVLLHPDDEFASWFTLWTDIVLVRRVRAVRGGVLVTTRPAFSAFAARLARGSVLLVAQEHTHLDVLAGGLRSEVARTYGGCDAVVLLTERDRLNYTALLAAPHTRVLTIPNAVPRLPGAPLPVHQRRRAVVAAGRLTPQKGFDLLISAFALVTADHPEWVLEIYGGGPDEQALSEQVEQAGLRNIVTLPGAIGHLGEVMAQTAVFVLSSRYEGLPMVLLEAMAKQMAVIAYDCPTGPREIITNAVDGLLIPPQDVHALAAGLRELMSDASLRARLGAGAAVQAGHHDLTDIGELWTRLLDDLPDRTPSGEPGVVRPLLMPPASW